MRRSGRAFCCYCKRDLTASSDRAGTAFTFDHVRPRADGGRRRVPCCRTCNQLKGDLRCDDWFWFIGAYSRWWKQFETHQQVREMVRLEHVRRIREREVPAAQRHEMVAHA